MFCKYCGEKLDDKILNEKHIAYCPSCGKVNKQKAEEDLAIKQTQNENIKIDGENYNTKVYQKDSGSALWGLLGFFFPLVGFILYLCWIKTSPKSANSAGAGALICVVLGIIATLVFVVLSMFTNIQLPAEFFY